MMIFIQLGNFSQVFISVTSSHLHWAVCHHQLLNGDNVNHLGLEI